MYEHIQVTEADGIATITLNRPDKLNAFIGHMRRDLAEVPAEPPPARRRRHRGLPATGP